MGVAAGAPVRRSHERSEGEGGSPWKAEPMRLVVREDPPAGSGSYETRKLWWS
jgi:hypothetical protein